MAGRQDPHLPAIAMSCWKRSPGLLSSPHPRSDRSPESLGEERSWENPLPQPEAMAAGVRSVVDGEEQSAAAALGGGVAAGIRDTSWREGII